MRFGVLGALEVLGDDGSAVRVSETKVRLLLAALLAREGQSLLSRPFVWDLDMLRLLESPWCTGFRFLMQTLDRSFGGIQPGSTG